MRLLAALLATGAVAIHPTPVLAGPGEGVPIPYSLVDAQRGAQLRSDAAIVIPIIHNPCGISPAMAPTIERYRQIVSEVSDLRRRLDFAIARADYDYQMSLVDIYCPEQSVEQREENDRLEISVANSTMDRIEKMLAELAERGE